MRLAKPSRSCCWLLFIVSPLDGFPIYGTPSIVARPWPLDVGERWKLPKTVLRSVKLTMPHTTSIRCQCGHLQPERAVAAEFCERDASCLYQQTLRGTRAVLRADS